MMFTLSEIKNRFTKKIGCTPVFKALIISTLLHLLLFTIVSIVVEPDLKLSSYPKVTFLGSILNQDTVFPVRLSIKNVTSADNSVKSNFFTDTSPRSLKERRKQSKEVRAALKIRHISFNKKFQISSETIFNKSKQQPKYSGRDVPTRSRKLTFVRLRARKQFKGTANIFWHPPYQRDIFYEPPLPREYLRTDNIEGGFNLEFEFLVSPQGRVVAIRKLTSSGYSEIDAQAIRYLKKWQFAPSPREQWGKIRLNFKLQ